MKHVDGVSFEVIEMSQTTAVTQRSCLAHTRRYIARRHR